MEKWAPIHGGRGQLQLWVFLSFIPLKPKKWEWGQRQSFLWFWGYFEDRGGQISNFGDFLGKVLKKPQKSGWGRGKNSQGFCPAYLRQKKNSGEQVLSNFFYVLSSMLITSDETTDLPLQEVK